MKYNYITTFAHLFQQFNTSLPKQSPLTGFPEIWHHSSFHVKSIWGFTDIIPGQNFLDRIPSEPKPIRQEAPRHNNIG